MNIIDIHKHDIQNIRQGSTQEVDRCPTHSADTWGRGSHPHGRQAGGQNTSCPSLCAPSIEVGGDVTGEVALLGQGEGES